MLRLYTHASCLQHDPGPAQPESPARLRAVLQALDHDRFAAIDRVEAPRATREQLLRVHTAEHVERILAIAPDEGTVRLDEDTLMSPGSAEAALRAAGAVVAAVDAVLGADGGQAFCAVRPPGHHATPDRAMGFCLFNNVAVGAAHAIAEHGLKRVAIADFDVHHGNGTQDIFAREPRVLFISSHQMPLYPETGRADERGVGNIVNAPLSPGDGSCEFRELWESTLIPKLHDTEKRASLSPNSVHEMMRRRFSATSAASHKRPSTSRANSSPPRRPTVSLTLAASCATARITASPIS